MSTELLPCPYCGEEPVIRGEGVVMCNNTKELCQNRASVFTLAAWNRRFVCPDKNGDKVFAGDTVWVGTGVALYKGIVTWRDDHADWVVLRKGRSVGWGIRSDEIELVKEMS